ncbi:MAG TPA: formyltransferase family protein [Candidatus Dormibacteraeota bacterium]|jgi:methionyl-tRNA formyltransferase|nr:formyltransferase family protein [Candidatus Dormibacteraeota bacterium]
MATTSDWLTDAERSLWSRDLFSFIPDRTLDEPYGEPRSGGGPRVVFAGFPSDYSLAFLLGLLRLDVELVGIVTSPGAHPAILGTNALSQISGHLRIPLLRPWRINEEHPRQDLARLQPALGVIASFDQILGARTLAIPAHGWLNVHPSALPQYRGPEPIYWTIADGAEETGITLHRAVPKFDAGPILAQRRLHLDPDETAGTLTRRLSELGAAALGEAVAGMLADDPGVEFDLADGSYRPSVGHRHLAAAHSAVEAERMVRAGVPNMPAWTEVEGHPVFVNRARVVTDCGAAAGLRYEDGCLQLLETAVACGCHHDDPHCPHREWAD